MSLIDVLCRKTLTEEEFVREVAEIASLSYFCFPVKKSDGSDRLIYHPSKEVKLYQRVLVDEFISKLPIHDCCYAYRKGKSIAHHAKQHAGAAYLMRIDLKNFFESIRLLDVMNFCENTVSQQFKGWTQDDSNIFSKFVCHKGGLTMGSVTSPSLSNVMCYQMDVNISNLVSSYGVKYTRYADDMFFSCSERGVIFSLQRKIENIISNLECPSNLKVNTEKTWHSSKKNKMMVTGLVLSNDGKVTIGRKEKRRIKSFVFNWVNLDTKRKLYLSGYLAHVRSVEPEFINVLCKKYGAEIIRDIIVFNG